MKLKDEIEVRNQKLQVLIDASLELAATCSGGYTWMKELVERDEDFIWQKVATDQKSYYRRSARSRPCVARMGPLREST